MSLGRTVFVGTGSITAAAVSSRVLALVSTPILTARLGTDSYGVAALVGTIVSLASTTALLGVDMAYARYYFEGTGNVRSAVENFCWRFALGSSVVTAILAALIWIFLQTA